MDVTDRAERIVRSPGVTTSQTNLQDYNQSVAGQITPADFDITPADFDIGFLFSPHNVHV